MLYGTPNLPHKKGMTLLAVQPSGGDLPLLQSRALERMRNSPERCRGTRREGTGRDLTSSARVQPTHARKVIRLPRRLGMLRPGR